MLQRTLFMNTLARDEFELLKRAWIFLDKTARTFYLLLPIENKTSRMINLYVRWELFKKKKIPTGYFTRRGVTTSSGSVLQTASLNLSQMGCMSEIQNLNSSRGCQSGKSVSCRKKNWVQPWPGLHQILLPIHRLEKASK